MDLINLPVTTLVEPVRLTSVDSKTVKFEVSPQISDIISQKGSTYKVEIRGMRLSDVPFKNSWPNFGTLGLNGADWSHTLTLPEREQSRKRKDEPFDLTPCFKKKGRKTHLLTLVKKKHPPKQDKNEDNYHYVIGIYLVQILEVPQIISYHKKYELESFLSTYNMICERLFPNQKEDDIHVLSDELKIPMKCPITLSEVKIPAKGYQ